MSGVEILLRDMNAGGSIGGAGAACHEDDPGLAGCLAYRLGHHSGSAFLAADRYRNGGIMQRIQNGQKALARDTEHMFDAVDDQLVDQDLRRRAKLYHGLKLQRLRIRCRRDGTDRGYVVP